ncbi:hypothetical protein C1A38_14295 [Verrucosispora sp. ts21]|nr:hypothetical protein C1A38_14295 [Verrucosispora sp. ts21]
MSPKDTTMTNSYGAPATPAPGWAPAPPAQWGPASTGPNERRRRIPPKLAVAVAGSAVVVVALVVVLALVWPGLLHTKVFDTAAVQQGVLSVLRDDYRLDADLVACPPDQPVTVGSRFSCSAQIAGVPTAITVTVLSTDGRFEVARPQ